jgi:hypothetical protein
MRTLDSLETDTRVVDAPDEPRETVESPQGQVLDDPERRREESAESQQRVEGDWDERPFKADRAELARFDLKRAGLPDMSIESANKYIDEHRDSRPWLAMTDHASPEARRIIAAMDLAGVHPHIRHEGWVTEEANRRRVTHREDPAQLNQEKQALSIDGLRPNDKRHRCADIATRITDPDAFATAYVRGVEHPKMRKALDMAFDPTDKPEAVTLPIADLLGADGHGYCTGWRLKPVDGSMETAYAKRNSWVVARVTGGRPDPCEPDSLPVSTFEGGVITFMFAGNETERRYDIMTMCPDPPDVRRSES